MSSNPNFPEHGSTPGSVAKDAMNAASDAAKQAADAARHAADRAADRAGELGRDTVDKLDASREPLAQGIQRTADAIRSHAPESVADKAHSTAEAMENAAGYIRNKDVRSMAADLTDAVRSNPGPSLVAAVAVGFLLGFALRRGD